MAREKKNLVGVASLNHILAEGSQAIEGAATNRLKTKTKTEKPFDPRADNDDSSSSEDNKSDDSDDDKPPSASMLARLNKTTNKSPAAPTRSGISPSHRAPRGKEDEIADSDAERGASAKTKDSSKNIKTEPSSDSSEAGSDNDSSDGDDKELKLKRDADASSTSSSSSDSSENDSSDDSDEDAQKKKNSPVNKKKAASTKGKSTAAASTSSDSDSSEEETATNQKPAAAAKADESDGDISLPDADAASDNDESESDSDSEDNASSAVTRARRVSRPNSQVFAGLDIRRVDETISVKEMSLFLSKTKSKNQQAWIFSVPKSSTVKVIEKLDFTAEVESAVRAGKKARKSKDDDTSSSTSYKIILCNVPPEKQRKALQIAPTPSKEVLTALATLPAPQVLRIQQSYDLSGLDAAPTLSARPPRPQPKGMRPRFRPLGVPPTEPMGDIGPSEDEQEEEDVDMTQASPAAAKKKSKSDKKSKKRQDAEPAAEPASTTKKSSKRKHQADDQDLASSQQAPEESSQKKKKAKKLKQDDVGETPVHKATPILPPTVPVSSQKRCVSEANVDAATPAPKSSKKNVSWSGVADRAAKESPVPIPYAGQRAAVPVPSIPSSGAVVQTPKASKKDKKKRSSDVMPSSQASIPAPRETPVPAPTIKTSSKSKK